MGAIIFLIYLLFFISFIYPAGAIVYFKLIKHSKKTISEILNLI